VTRQSIADIIRQQAVTIPDTVAIIGDEGSMTYAELDARSNRIAQALLRDGVGRQDRVAYLSMNRIDYYALAFAVSKIGAVTVPVNWRLAPQECAAVVADADPSILFVEPEVRDLLGDDVGLPMVGYGDLGDGSPDIEDWLGEAEPIDPGVVGDPDEIMWLLYTSGTTGEPKGVMLANRNLMSMIDGLADAWQFHPDRVVYLPYPAFHAVGTAWGILTFHRGGTVVLRRSFDPRDFLASVQQHGVTNTMMVPAVLQMVLATDGVDDADLSSLRTIVYGAAPITRHTLDTAIAKMPDVEFIHAYGLTEATGTVTNLPWAEHDPDGPRMRSCGRAFDWVSFRVVDPVTLEACAPGQAGEVWVQSPSVMAGYFRRPKETAEAITEDGWLRTGDAGHVDEDGYLYLTDRVKDMIISGGENIYPAEVENVLHGHPDVAQVAVVGVPDDRWGETVRAIVVPEPGTRPDPGDIIAYARERLAHYKCPTGVELRDEPLPLNPTGKVMRRELRRPYWEGREDAIR
jgi:long-chain acyl-CoA synthetase